MKQKLIDECHSKTMTNMSSSSSSSIMKEPTTSTIPTLGESIKKLKPYYGMAIPIQGKSGDILAAALVGHGGRITGTKKKGKLLYLIDIVTQPSALLSTYTSFTSKINLIQIKFSLE